MQPCSATETPLSKVPNLGPFGSGAPAWLAAGIPVFPVDPETKKAKVKNYLKMGFPASVKLAGRIDLAGCNLGFVGGPGSGLTVVDYDTTDRRVIVECERRFGTTPVKVQTGSGKFHGIYRFTDEGRHVRVFGKAADAPPIDILGNKSLVVAPHSLRNGRPYRFIEGGLGDLARVPPLKPGWRDGLAYFEGKGARQLNRESTTTIGEGVRNTTLFDMLRLYAWGCPSKELLLQYARETNATFSPPDDEASIVATATSVWSMKAEGRLMVPGSGGVVLSHGVLEGFLANTDKLGNSDALMLYAQLERMHRSRKESFAICAPAMARDMSMGCWNAKQIRRAREILLKMGLLEVVKTGGGGARDPFLYQLSGRVRIWATM